MRSNQKVQLIDTGLISISGEDNESKKVESFVGRHLLNYNPSCWREKEEVDFVLELDENSLLPIAVKYRSRVDKKDSEGMVKFMDVAFVQKLRSKKQSWKQKEIAALKKENK